MPKKPYLMTTVIIAIVLVALGVFMAFLGSQPTKTTLDPKIYTEIIKALQDTQTPHLLIHDIDYDPTGLETLVTIEEGLSERSIFFVRPDIEYLSLISQRLQQLEGEGWQIGFHYDCLSKANGSMEYAIKLFTAQLTYLRSFFNITTTHCHGDRFNNSISNLSLFNQTLWRSLSLKDITEIEVGSVGISDTYCEWHINEYREGVDFVIVLTHSDWFN